jgi:hypothetical protein
MSRSTAVTWHCDHGGCSANAPEKTEGWHSAIYTQGCPQHALEIHTHRAELTSDTRGRGAREKTTWYLHCACGWRPRPYYTPYTYDWLQKQHLAHVRAVTNSEEAPDAA